MGFSFFLKMESSCRIFSTCGVTVTGHVLIFQKKVKHLFVVTRFSSVGSRSGILGFLNGFDTEREKKFGVLLLLLKEIRERKLMEIIYFLFFKIYFLY